MKALVFSMEVGGGRAGLGGWVWPGLRALGSLGPAEVTG